MQKKSIFIFAVLFFLTACSPKPAVVIDTKPTKHRGYAGETPLQIALDKDAKIMRVEFLPNYETKIMLEQIEESGFMDSWNGLTVSEAIGKDVDAVTGATLTCQSVINTLREDLSKRLKRGEFEQLEKK